MKLELYSQGRRLDVDVKSASDEFTVQFDGNLFSVRFLGGPAGDSLVAIVDGRELKVTLEEETESALRITVDGHPIILGRALTQIQAGHSERVSSSQVAAEENSLSSPLFGKVISVDVSAGDEVTPGQSLVVLEAMKMESVLRSDGIHRVKEVLVKAGDGVNNGQVLLRYD